MEEEENDNTLMLVCDTCGCPVEYPMAERHSEWHDSLLTKHDLIRTSLANADRTKVD